MKNYIDIFRDGRLEVNDELVSVNGSHLRGMDITDAIQILRSASSSSSSSSSLEDSDPLDIVIYREAPLKQGGQRLFSPQKVEEEHLKITQKLTRNKNQQKQDGGDGNFVTRTYISGNSSNNNNNLGNLAQKIHHRRSKMINSIGSLTSLHETNLLSDSEDVRSSVSAYLPVYNYADDDVKSTR